MVCRAALNTCRATPTLSPSARDACADPKVSPCSAPLSCATSSPPGSTITEGCCCALRIQKIAASAPAQHEYTALSITQRAHRIAEHYLEDPASWAAADLKGKGITVCQEAVDPLFPGDISLVYRSVITRINPVFNPVWSDRMFIKKYDYT